NVQPPVPVDHLLDDPFAVLVARDVALMDAHIRAELCDELLRRVDVPRVARCHTDACIDEPFADGAADPAHTAGDECDLLLERGLRAAHVASPSMTRASSGLATGRPTSPATRTSRSTSSAFEAAYRPRW